MVQEGQGKGGARRPGAGPMINSQSDTRAGAYQMRTRTEGSR